MPEDKDQQGKHGAHKKSKMGMRGITRSMAEKEMKQANKKLQKEGILFGWRSLLPNRPISMWLACGISVWLSMARIVFWLPSAAAYLLG